MSFLQFIRIFIIYTRWGIHNFSLCIEAKREIWDYKLCDPHVRIGRRPWFLPSRFPTNWSSVCYHIRSQIIRLIRGREILAKQIGDPFR